MPRPPAEIELGEEQALYFRARRGHLAGRGAGDAAAAARAILGAQAQQLAPSLLALSQRAARRPAAARLEPRLLDGERDLVRTWGQRETLHVYDAAADWGDVVAAREQWVPGGRRGALPPAALVDQAQDLLEAAGAPVTRRDLYPLVPKSFLREVEAKVGPGDAAWRLAAGRLLWRLALRGDACMAGKVGTEQAYAARRLWFPDLGWDPPPPVTAATRLTGRYLAAYGPATVTDVAHFFGARVREARVWIDALAAQSALVPVSCGGRNGLVALARDARELKKKPPAGARQWPLRLLPLWDSMLMGHADKTWTVPAAADQKLVWRRAAFVCAAVVLRGRIVATWSHAQRAGRLEMELSPLSGWRSAKHAAAVRREARAVATHLGLQEVVVTVAG